MRVSGSLSRLSPQLTDEALLALFRDDLPRPCIALTAKQGWLACDHHLGHIGAPHLSILRAPHPAPSLAHSDDRLPLPTQALFLKGRLRSNSYTTSALPAGSNHWKPAVSAASQLSVLFIVLYALRAAPRAWSFPPKVSLALNILITQHAQVAEDIEQLVGVVNNTAANRLLRRRLCDALSRSYG